MFAVGLPELIALLVVVLPVVVLVLLVRLGRRNDVVPRREWALVRATRVLCVIVGAAAACWVLGSHDRFRYGLSTLLAPAVFGLVVVLGVALGETVVRRRRDAGPRTASLRPRTAAAYLPRFMTASVAVAGVTLFVLLVATTLTASAATDGHLRALSCAHHGWRSTATPYPGAYYSLPLAALIIVTLAIAAWATKRVVDRPRGLATTEHGDDVLRKRSLIVIVAAVGVAVCVSLTGVALDTSQAWANARCNGSGVVDTVLDVIAGLGFLLGIWCFVRIFSNDPMDRPWS